MSMPLANGDLVKALMRTKISYLLTKTKYRRRETMGGGYNQLVEKLHTKFNMSGNDGFNPCKITRILLADDDAISNYSLKAMIEQDSDFQVVSYSNGAEVLIFCCNI